MYIYTFAQTYTQ